MKFAGICFVVVMVCMVSVMGSAQEYVIGPDDVIEVSYWRNKEHSAEVTVRPDGLISLPLIGEVQVAGLTPSAVGDRVRLRAAEFLQEPVVTVVVKRINSRKVFITGEVTRPGAYPITGPTTVMQMIATAGGLTDFADRSAIVLIRAGAGGTDKHLVINYNQIAKLQKLEQNVELRPGDTIVVR